VALHKKGAAAAAAFVRGLSDAELAKTGTVFTGMPPMSDRLPDAAEMFVDVAQEGALDHLLGGG